MLLHANLNINIYWIILWNPSQFNLFDGHLLSSIGIKPKKYFSKRSLTNDFTRLPPNLNLNRFTQFLLVILSPLKEHSAFESHLTDSSDLNFIQQVRKPTITFVNKVVPYQDQNRITLNLLDNVFIFFPNMIELRFFILNLEFVSQKDVDLLY